MTCPQYAGPNPVKDKPVENVVHWIYCWQASSGEAVSYSAFPVQLPASIAVCFSSLRFVNLKLRYHAMAFLGQKLWQTIFVQLFAHCVNLTLFA